LGTLWLLYFWDEGFGHSARFSLQHGRMVGFAVSVRCRSLLCAVSVGGVLGGCPAGGTREPDRGPAPGWVFLRVPFFLGSMMAWSLFSGWSVLLSLVFRGIPSRPCSAWNVGGWGGGLFWLRGVRCSLFTWLGLPRSMRWVREEIVRVLRAPSPRFHLAGSHRSERGGVGVALPVLRARFLRPPVGAVGARRRVALFATRLRVTAHVTGWMWGWF
jgi:hypothetical protein